MAIEQIDQYEIVAEIGHGGMATVYHARGPDGADVAIKVLHRHYLTDLGFRTRFEQEAQTIARLEHPAIVPLLSFGQYEEQLYLVMPHMVGGSLSLRLCQRALAPETVGTILARIAGALDEAHARGIIHRDLKPSNILFDADGQAYLADFGTALQTATEGSRHAVIDGTPAYMSPEQCRSGTNADGRSDVYSLGVTLFQMLTGHLPFSGDTPLAILAQHVHQPPPALRALNPDLPTALEPVVNRALAKELNARYETAGALSAAYQQALGSPVEEGDAATASSGDTYALQMETPASKRPPAISPRPADATNAANQWEPLQARASRLVSDARQWTTRHLVVALALVNLLGLLCAAGAIMAIRGPSLLQTWGVGANLFPSRKAVTFLPLISTERTNEEALAPASDATPTPAPNLLLLYTVENAAVINISNENLSLSGLTFRRPAAEGASAATFAADEWGRVAGRAVAALSPNDCLQLLRLDGSSPQPQAPPACDRLRGWLATSREERLFFLPAADTNAFEVLRAGQFVGRCAIADGECQLYVPQP